MRPHRSLVAVVVLALAVTLVAAAPAAAKKKGKAPTEPGSYHDWNGDMDEVEVVETFRLADYQRLLVADFDTAETPLPERDDNTWEPVQEVLSDVGEPLLNGLRETLPGVAVERRAEGGGAAEGALLLRGKVLEMDPGSRAARYWAGFGAGAARAKLQGEVVDAASGRVLLRFTQERRSGVGMGGGNYVNLMRRNLFTIGEDLGSGLGRF